MNFCKLDPIKLPLIQIFGLIFLTTAAILLTIGSIFYVEGKSKILNVAQTQCVVDKIFTKTSVCILYIYQHNCYVAAWSIHHLQRGNRFSKVYGTTHHISSSNALKEAHKHPVDSVQTCWYDKRSPWLIQFTKPNTSSAIIHLICGVISLILSIICLYYMYILMQQRIRRNTRTLPHIQIIYLK
ncbi:hypothetical protein I4U23_010230 [Adineta vaga]|nr:hypothetical protein I4U23_010230 [Adineta vaga]